MVPLIILLVVVALAVAAKLKWNQLTAGVDEQHRLAAEQGYELVRADRAAPDTTLDLFTAVSDRKVKQTIERPGSPDSVFIYRFDVVREGVEQKQWTTCALVQLPFGAPKTLVRPHSRQTVPPTPTDGADLELGLERFDQAFRLQATDETFARNLLHDDFAAWLLTDEARVGEIEYEFRGEWLLCAAPRAEAVGEMLDLLHFAQAVRDRAAAAVQPDG